MKMLIPDGWQIELMVPRLRPARHAGFIHARKSRTACPWHLFTNASTIFMVRCGFLAKGAGITRSSARSLYYKCSDKKVIVILEVCRWFGIEGAKA